MPPRRLAVFTPLPPDRSGIAACSAELLPALARHADVEVFLERALPPGADAPAILPTFPAFAFQPRHRAAPFDLVVYQLGNARCHDYMWAYLVHFPGLVVLHDAQLHHARAAALLRRGRERDYRAEFAFSHPDASPDIAEFVVNGLQGSPYFLWPHRRVALAAARAVAVHNERLAEDLRGEAGDTPVVALRMGTRPHAPRRRAHVDGAGPVFAAFGGITHEKRIPQVLRAFGQAARAAPGARLLLVGEARDHYDVLADARALGVADRVIVTGYVADEDLDDWIEAADVCLCLRWPTSRETSASWVRCLAAGKPTVFTDLAHLVDVPSLDPRTWEVQHASPAGEHATNPPRREDAVGVAIDILDEDHSLGLALRRLAEDAPLRERLGARGRAWWEAHHTLPQMVDDYLAAFETALAAPARPASWASLPSHLRSTGIETLEAVLGEVGVPGPDAVFG